MLDDLSDVLADLATGTDYTATRANAPTFVAGMVTPDPAPLTLTNIVASIQPATGEDLKRLPEGDRDSEVVTIYTSTKLRTASVQKGYAADLFEAFGNTYQVEHVDPWGANANYCRAVARRVGQ